jgi:drug/metabolite transporter (DMT)-like permease
MLRWFHSDSRLPWVILALMLAMGWSTSGLIFRNIEAATAPQIIFYRGLCLTFAVVSFVVWRYRFFAVRAFVSTGKAGIAGAFGLGLASVAFISAMEHTTIANISFMIAATPFFSGVMAWFALRETMALRTIIATLVAMCGVLVMVGEGFALGSLHGNLLALSCALLSSVYIVAVRFGKGVDMVPTVAMAGAVAAGTAFLLMESFEISLHDLALCALQGIFISALCNGLLTLCARHIPAGELTVLSLLESALSPLWVFLFLSEVPTTVTLIGGTVILSAILLQAFWPGGRRREQD